jgi:tRNA(Ile)-lysidine synthase
MVRKRKGQRDALLSGVAATIDRYEMMGPEAGVLVAVSGGADSVALVYALVELGYRVEVAHFDHMTRGGVSAEDATFVAALAREFGVPFHGDQQDVEAIRAGRGESFEACARDLRYEFLLETARAQECKLLATGHHQDDVAETVLMRLLRGAGPGGLAGIPPVRDEDDVRIVRPLLDCTRAEIQAWLTARGVSWREDSSNTDEAHLRNRVRHDLLPTLSEQYNPQLTGALARFADAQRVDSALLDGQADAAFEACFAEEHGVSREAFAALHEALQRRCMLRVGWAQEVELEHERVVGAVDFVMHGATGKYFDLGGGLSLYQGRTHTRVLAGEEIEAAGEEEISLAVPGKTVAMGREFSVGYLSELPKTSWSAYCGAGCQVFDADRVGETLCVRPRRPGDRFRPFGMTGTRKLKDYLIDLGVPTPDRDGMPLVTSGDEILWVVGKGTSAAAAVTQDTARILEIRVTLCA